jgi:hypothetical protein
LDSIRVPGLTRLDSLDLRRQFPDAAITFDEGTATDQEHGELVTVAVIGLTLVGLRALAAWLLKNRRGAVIEKTVVVTHGDGSTRTETIKIKVSESTSEADVVKELANITHLDLGELGLSTST